MRLRAGSGGSRLTVVASVLGGAALVAVAFWALRQEGPPATEDVVRMEAAPSVEVATEAASETAPETALAADPDTDQATSAAEQPEAPAPRPPRFDQIRVAPDGLAVIAGSAPPGAAVSLRLDGTEIGTAQSGTGGGFATILILDPADTPRILSLAALTADGSELIGRETVIIAPFGAAATVTEVASGMDPRAEITADAQTEGQRPGDTGGPPQTAAATAPPAADAAEEADATEVTGTLVAPPGVTGAIEAPLDGEAGQMAMLSTSDPNAPAPVTPAPEVPAPETLDIAAVDPAMPTTEPPAPRAEEVEVSLQEAPAPPGAAPDMAQPGTSAPAPEPSDAPALVMAGPDGLRILRGGSDGPPAAQTSVQIDAISYDADGAVTLSGVGGADRRVQVLLDNTPIVLGEIGPGGQWSLELPDVDPGTYTLSVAQLAPDGAIETRIDTPFLREDPARIAASPMLVDPGVSVITVQPGFTLWGIAEANFGEGIAYVQIFEENMDRIRDPDWIYPGQIFRLPDLPRGVGADP
jgi:nucleoid-associated protein YgaU